MDEKKPSTAEILAKIRAQKAAAGAKSSATGENAAEPALAAAPAGPPAETAPSPPPAPAASVPPTAAGPKPGAPAGKPASTKDILAAIRAGKGGAKPAEAATASAATAPAPETQAVSSAAATPAKGTAAASTAPLPSVAEMVKAVRQGVPAAPPAAAKPKPVVPPMPARPAPAAAKAPSPVRRAMGLGILGALFYVVSTPFRLAWTACTLVGGISVLGTARFMFPNVLVEPPSKFKVGPASDYPLNSVSNKWKDQYGIWIVHTDQYEGKNLIFALQTVCTHLGCTPNWLDGEQKFKCPCHGSGFYITGVNFEGPAPRPLERVGLRIAEDGMLEVDKSVKFQEEMGQWKDPASFVEVV
uniref:Ubiquinol-cytochrome c reductase iron-sulfur subunit n=1 Tax=Schlesneria paludicola TaxID=360056 RepID=A0A7C4QT77_9PLAN